MNDVWYWVFNLEGKKHSKAESIAHNQLRNKSSNFWLSIPNYIVWGLTTPNNIVKQLLNIHKKAILHLLFDSDLQLSLSFGQFFLQTLALLCTPLQLLLQPLQTCCRPLVSLILLLVKRTEIKVEISMQIQTSSLLHYITYLW